jgi:hypothetical protein
MNALVPGGLFVAAVALAATLAYQATAPIPVIAASAAKAAPIASTAVQPLPQYTPPPPDEFAVVNLRPLFSPTREPVAEASETGTTSQPPPDVTLIGVAVGLRNSVALLKSPNDPVAISAMIGQVIDGWRLVRIDANQVVFSANGSDYAVKMRAAAGTTPATAATTTTHQ